MSDHTYFFSYSRTDSEFVLKLAKDLRSAGVKAWLDQLDIVPGEHWDRAIQNAIDIAEGIILILSPDAVKSENVMDEVSFAMQQDDQIVPVLIRECKIPLRLSRLHRINFTKDYDLAFEHLLYTLGAKDTLSDAEVSEQDTAIGRSTTPVQPNSTSEQESEPQQAANQPASQQRTDEPDSHPVHPTADTDESDSALDETIVQSLHVIVQWDDEVREFSGDFTIGRDKNNAIQLNDPQVSRQHAAVTFESGGWVLSDLGSRNGVRLNGKLIKRAELPQEASVQLHMYGTPLLIRVI